MGRGAHKIRLFVLRAALKGYQLGMFKKLIYNNTIIPLSKKQERERLSQPLFY